MNKDRNFLGVWIPKNVYLNTDLSWSEKILLVEIESLDNEKGCFASNDYFADFLGVTKTTISTSISKLKKLGFLEQVSFDGRTRVIKVISSEFKKKKKQSLKKPKGRTKENLIHNNTVNNTSNNTTNLKDKKIDKKSLVKTLKAINDLESSAVCIEVDELKNQGIWLEHTARHLKLSLYWVKKLLAEFIDEQKLKDDAFKSLKETKSHFLNWSKIQVKKNRQFGNDSWGRTEPQHVRTEQRTKKPIPTKPELSDKEKRELHLNFLKENLIAPYNLYLKTGTYPNLNDFGSLISNELKKHGLLITDSSKIPQLKNPKTKKTSNETTISKMFNKKSTSKSYVNSQLLRLTFESMRDKGIDLSKVLLYEKPTT